MLSVSSLVIFGLTLQSRVSATILQNGQVKPTNYLDTRVDSSAYLFTTYPANATEISYKGRWDSKHVSWWSAPGIKFGYTGQTVAISFGNLTTNGVLVAYRISGLDWSFTNVTGKSTHLLVSPSTPGAASAGPISPWTFEMRVTNWAFGVQIEAVHVAAGERLIKLPDFDRRIEVIGDSLAAGMYTSYEGLSNEPEPWDFSKSPPADLVIINIGTNDRNAHNNVSTFAYIDALTKIIQGVHGKWPKAQVIVMSLWLGFYQSGNTYFPNAPQGWVSEVSQMVNWFNSDYLRDPVVYDGVTKKSFKADRSQVGAFVHYFNTTGIMQHNDIGPQWHPTDVGAIKVASHLQQFIRVKFGWDLHATGPEVFHDTQYWNDEPGY
ncbi:Lipase, GDSL-like protein [Podospora didyma]|uniref:Lipase, GDSL-like protein n=1 Tax=Podospora didyma TaxID=330526 RepID=A0AAE0P7G5_9PEZI|nr:Lipase, GDSL-like protein [Podospora didyma]